MRLLLPLTLLAAASLSAIGCRPATLTAQRRGEIAAEIEREVRSAYDLSKPGVEQRMLALYGDSTDTTRVVSAAAGRALASRDSLLAGVRYFWERVGTNMQEPRWVWDRMLIDVLCDDAAVMTATYHIPHRTPKGEPHVLAGAWTAVFQRRGGRWVVVQEHLSDLPAAQAAMSGMPM